MGMRNFLWILIVGSLFLCFSSFAQELEENGKKILPPAEINNNKEIATPHLDSEITGENLLPKGITKEVHIFCDKKSGLCYVLSVDQKGIHEKVTDVNNINKLIGGE